MITVITFEVMAESGCSLPWFPGHETRAAFLRLIRESDPELSEALHEGIESSRGRASVFSLKCLRFESKYTLVYPSGRRGEFPEFILPIDANYLVEEGGRGWFSVTVLSDDLASKVVKAVANYILSSIDVKGCMLKLIGVRLESLDPGGILNSVTEVTDSADLYFISPTYLNPLRGSKKYKLLYPQLDALMASLISLTHRVTGKSLPRPEELASKVFVSGIHIRTPKVELRKKEPTPTGFVGWVKLRFTEEAKREERKLVLGMLKLSEYLNVGGNRSAGYGEVKAVVGGTGK